MKKKVLRHLLIPHESNNHRAKLLHHSSLLVLIIGLFLLGSFFSFTDTKHSAVLGISYQISTDELLILTNAKRQEQGLPALTMSSELAQAASRKAADMFAKNYWAHIAPDGTTPWYFIRSSGYEYVYAGENLARGYTTSGDVVNAWMASPTHRDNLLSSNYKDVGFAVLEGNLTGDDTVLVVQEFGSKTREIAGTQSVQPIPPTPTPTSAVVQVAVRPIATPTLVPTATPTPTPTPMVLPTISPFVQVAALTNSPLIDKPSAQRSIAFLVAAIILSLLVVDIIVIEKKGVVRMLSHNFDHLIFFGLLLILILLIAKGGVL